MNSSRLFSVAVLTAAIMISGTACAPQPDKSAPRVATLQTGTPPATESAAPPADNERVRYRLDDTDADRTAKDKAYVDCLKSHGVDVVGIRGGKLPEVSRQVSDAANKVCDGLRPLEPWEMDPANPEARDFTRDVVKCLKDTGVNARANSDGVGVTVGGSPDDQGAQMNAMAAVAECEQEVFKKRK
jgi:hypothetical protein